MGRPADGIVWKRHCTQRSFRTGAPCRRWATRGCNVCSSHGAQLPNVKAAGERMLHDLRMDGLRRMAAAIPTVVDGVEAVARDDQAPARDRVRAFEAVARAVFPQSGSDHVAHQAFADAKGDRDRTIKDLLRVPRADVERRIVDELGDFVTPEQAERLVDLWYLHAGGTIGRDPVSALSDLMEDAWRAVTLDPDAEAETDGEVVELRAIEASTVDDDEVSDLLDLAEERGHDRDEILATLRALIEIDDGDGS